MMTFLAASTVLALQFLPVQQLSCFPLEADSTDRAVFSFDLSGNPRIAPVKGTLFLSSGLDDWGNQDTTGILPMTFERTNPEGRLEYAAENENSRFRLEVESDIFGQSLDDVSVILSLSRKDGTGRIDVPLTCFTTVVETERG